MFIGYVRQNESICNCDNQRQTPAFYEHADDPLNIYVPALTNLNYSSIIKYKFPEPQYKGTQLNLYTEIETFFNNYVT